MVRSSLTGSNEEVILERAISGREYIALLKQQDMSRLSVKKKVQCFLWNNVYYELQTYEEPNIGLTVLRTEVSNPADIEFPGFLKISEEVTGISQFTSYNLAAQYYGEDAHKRVSWKENTELVEALRNSHLESSSNKE